MRWFGGALVMQQSRRAGTPGGAQQCPATRSMACYEPVGVRVQPLLEITSAADSSTDAACVETWKSRDEWVVITFVVRGNEIEEP